MPYVLLFVSALAALFFAIKFYRQRRAIGLLADSLAAGTSILNHSQEFRWTSSEWSRLVDGLNAIIEEIARLDKQSNDRLRQIETTLGSLQEGVLIIDRSNYILLANKALRARFPSLKNGVDKRLESSLHSSDFLGYIREVKQHADRGVKEFVFYEGKEEIWMEVSATELKDADGEGPWYLFVLHETTKLKKLERMRQRFVANASHELKTPISVIKGYAETLMADKAVMADVDRDRFIDTIHRHADRLALLINDLLSLSRLENETAPLGIAHRDVFDWLRGASSDFRENLSSKGRELQLSVPEGIEANVSFDRIKMRQVLDNLIENAWKYTPEGGIVCLGGEISEKTVRIWVADEGRGVPEEELEKIFERFYRVDKGRSRDTGGTGLGLSIVKHIVELHSGRVWAERIQEGGLKVVFELPLVSRAGVQPSDRVVRESGAV